MGDKLLDHDDDESTKSQRFDSGVPGIAQAEPVHDVVSAVQPALDTGQTSDGSKSPAGQETPRPLSIDEKARVLELRDLAEVVARSKAAMLKGEHRSEAVKRSFEAWLGVIDALFTDAMGKVAANGLDPATIKPVFDALNTDRIEFQSNALDEYRIAFQTRASVPKYLFQPESTDKHVQAVAAGLNGNMAWSVACITNLLQDEHDANDEQYSPRQQIDESLARLTELAKDPIPAIALTAQALVSSKYDSQSVVSVSNVTAMAKSGLTVPALDWDDDAEIKKLDDEEERQRRADSYPLTVGLPEEEKEKIRTYFEVSLDAMNVYQLQAIISDPDSQLGEYRNYYDDKIETPQNADDKKTVEAWISRMIDKAKRLLPDAPADLPEPGEIDEGSRDEDLLAGFRDRAERARADQSEDNAPERRSLDFSLVFASVIERMHIHAVNYELMLPQRMEKEAEIREDAKEFVRALRAVLATGLGHLAADTAEEAKRELSKLEKLFVAIAMGNMDPPREDRVSLAGMNRQYSLSIDAAVLKMAERLDDALAFHWHGNSYGGAWENLVEDRDKLAQGWRRPLQEQLNAMVFKDLIGEKIREHISQTLEGPISGFWLPTNLFNPY